MIKDQGWDVAQWCSTYLACARPWVGSQHEKRKDTHTKKDLYPNVHRSVAE
jgi:hypothetical protein